MIQHYFAIRSRRYRGTVVGVLAALSGMMMAGLPDCRAQVYYSGGLRVRHQNPPQTPGTQQPAPQPVVPKTPLSYFPDNDLAYPSFYPGGEPKGPLPAAVGALLNLAPAVLPWNQPGFEAYNELPQIPRDSTVRQPKKYALEALLLPQAPASERLENSLLIAHVPENAAFWVEGARTRSIGRTRCFQSPPLLPGRKYNYRVSATWIEDGSWVGQTRVVPVEAGLIQAIYLRPTLPLSPARSANEGRPR